MRSTNTARRAAAYSVDDRSSKDASIMVAGQVRAGAGVTQQQQQQQWQGGTNDGSGNGGDSSSSRHR